MYQNNNQMGLSKNGRSESLPIPRGPGAFNNTRSAVASSRVEMQVSFTTTSSEGTASLNSSGSFGHFQLPFHPAVSDDALLVSEKLVHWETLLRYLYQPEDPGNLIDQIKRDSHNDTSQETCSKALQAWRRKMGSEASLDSLCEALLKMGRKDIVEAIYEKRGLKYNFDTRMSEMDRGFNSVSSNCSDFVNLGIDEVNADIERVFPEDSLPRKYPGEVKELISALEDPYINVVSLAGPQNSGKSITLDLLQRELDGHNSFQRTKIIKIRCKGQVDSKWLAREIAVTVEQAPQGEIDQSSYAERNLVGLLGPYEDIILILDLSLIPISEKGKGIIDYLLKLHKNKKLAKKLRLVISTMTSLWNSILFIQSCKSLKEITVKSMKPLDAVGYIMEMNKAFPIQVAEAIVEKIDCYPFYLKQIAHTDIEKIFVRKGDEEIVRAIEMGFEGLDGVLFHPDVEEAISIVFDCLSERKKALLVQVLTFANCFGLEQAQRVVDHMIDINDSVFNPLCEQGALFLKREATESTVFIYRIPKIQGDMLRNIVNRSDQFSEMYHTALSKHQHLYLDLLVLLSNCFMGDAPSKSEELRVLEPFTPSDGVPANQSLAIEDNNERTSRVVRCFKQQSDDVIKSLMYYNHSMENYNLIIGVITQLNVYYFLTHMLSSHQSLEVYRKLKRKATSEQDHASRDKLNVFIASLLIDAKGESNYNSEANSLYVGSADSLQGNVYAYCLQRMIGNRLVEGKLLADPEGQKRLASEYINKVRDAFQEYSCGKEASKVYIADCTRLLEGISGAFSEERISQMISTCDEVLGDRHPITCRFLKIKAKKLQERGEYKSGKKILLKILDAEEELLGRHFQTAATFLQLGGAMFAKYKFDLEEIELDSQPKSNDSPTSKVKFSHKALGPSSPRSRANTGELRSRPSEATKALSEEDVLKLGKSLAKPRIAEVLPTHEAAMFTVGIEKQGEIFSNDKMNLKYAKSLAVEEEQKSPSGRSQSTSSDSTVKAYSVGEAIVKIKALLKKAVGYFLYASGVCHDVHKCYLLLYEVSKMAGERSEAKAYLVKADECAKLLDIKRSGFESYISRFNSS